jgi:protein phosphatase
VNNQSIVYAGQSDCGLKRSSNQDSYLAADLTRSLRVESTNLSFETPSRLCGGAFGHLFIVADGMGGHQAGNRASELAINYFVTNLLNNLRWTLRPDRNSEQAFLAALQDVLVETHRAIISESKSTPEFKGMGTTLTAAYIVWPRLWIVHAGDTRCYISRHGELQRLTRDHTMASQLLEQGAITAEEASKSHWASVLWNAIGADADEVIADTYQLELQLGDRLLLCSDGLNKHVDDLAISELLNANPEPATACQKLIDLANSLGGSDNITAIVANFSEYLEPELITTIVPSAESEIVLEDLSRFASTADTTGAFPAPPNDTAAARQGTKADTNSVKEASKDTGEIDTLDF